MALKPARLQESEDGALRSLDYGDIYFQPGKGFDESDYVFLQQNKLPQRFKTATRFHIGELGFGTGLNFLLTARLWRDVALQDFALQDAHLHFISIEKHPLQLQDLKKVYEQLQLQPQGADLSFIADEVLHHYPPLIEGFHHLTLMGGRITLSLLFGDVADVLPQMSGRMDAWYLDGFAPYMNPEMWDEKLFPLIAARTKPGGTLTTFSSSTMALKGLAAGGFAVEKAKGFGEKKYMAVATQDGTPEKDPPRKTAAVIGAGIAGASAAYALAQRGHKVTVYERHAAPAQEASGNPVAILYPKVTVDASAMGRWHSHAFCFTRNLIDTLHLPSWQPSGVLRLDMSDAETARSQELMRRQEYPADFTLHTQKTAFGHSALLHAGAGFLDPREFCEKLLAHPNIATVYNSAVKSIDDITADIIVIAQANASKDFPQTAWLPLQPLRGQITYVRADEFSAQLHKVICHKGYIAPAQDGVHVIGATFQKEAVGKPDTRRADDAENIATLQKNLPGFHFSKKSVTGSRASWRATTPDKLPMAGLCPDYAAFAQGREDYIKNIFICTGFGAHGMTGAPLAGEIIAALVDNTPLPVPADLMDHLRPERFIRRDLRRGKI